MFQMKKYFTLMALTLFACVLIACSDDEGTSADSMNNSDVASDAGSSEVQEVKAKIAHVYPPDLFISKGYDLFTQKVSEKSDGKVQFTVYPAGQLYTDVAAPNAVSSGQIEMGVNTLEMWSSNIAATEFTTLPIFDNAEHLRKSMANGLNELLATELNKLGAHPLLWAEFGFSFFASSDEPLSTLDSFKNKKIRTTAPLMSKFVELAGGSPVAISGGEVPQALQRGTIDAAVSGVAGFAASQYYEYTNQYTGPFNAGLVLLSVNKKWWDGLNNATREVIVEAAKETEQWLIEQQETVYAQSVEKIESEGMQFTEFEGDQFKDIKAQLQEFYLEKSGDLGKQIIDVIEQNR